MAQDCPSVILDSVLKQLESPIFNSNKLHNNLVSELRDLQSKLELISGVVIEAELMAVLFPEVVGVWVRKLRRGLYEVEDLFDEALIRSTSASGMAKKVDFCIYSLSVGSTLAYKMNRINKTLDFIIDECCRCNLIAAVNPGRPQLRPAAKGILRYDPEYVRDDEFLMIGREDDKERVKEKLFKDFTKPVVGITGKAGVGKTTLCRAVYLDEDVKSHFEIRLWVDFGSVSDFSSINLWKKIIMILKPEEEHSEMEEHQLKDIFATFIAAKKTLLVLENSHSLEIFLSDLKVIVRRHAKIKILLSQLKFRHSTIGETYYVHELRDGISEEHSRSIFERSACGGNASVTQRDMQDWMICLGKQIIKRCHGNPAILKGVGTLLYGHDKRDMWTYFALVFDVDNQYVLYNKISEVSQFLPKRHQYINYLSLFKNDEFMYQDLMQQLAAHGFTNFSDTMRNWLSCGRLFPTYSRKDNWDDKSRCRIDLKRREIILPSGDAERTVVGWTNDDNLESARHVSISSYAARRQSGILPDCLRKNMIRKNVRSNCLKFFFESVASTRNATTTEQEDKKTAEQEDQKRCSKRTLLFFGESFPTVIRVQTLDVLFTRLSYLRVLSLQSLRLRKIPSSIGKLIHLKYLNLSGNNFIELPVSVCTLKNLWTLKLIHCSELKWFPEQITNFHHLKHLEISMCLDLINMPSKIAKLTTLQRLDRFVVNSRKGGLSYLEHLDNLNGNLSIELPRRWKDSVEDAKRAHLERKKGLTSLEFRWHGADHGDSADHDVLEQLIPCSGIENLLVVNFGGREFPRWFTSLEHLTEITLSRCANCSFLPPFGSLPNLRCLTLVSMSLEYLEEENIYNNEAPFPSLEKLRIGSMPNLKRWWSRNLNDKPTFSSIEVVVVIWRCPSLMATPPFSRIKQLVLQDVSDKVMQLVVREAQEILEMISIQGMVSLSSELVVRLPPTLTIRDCNQWKNFWTKDGKGKQKQRSLDRGFRRLEHLVIENCPAMIYLSTSLSRLTNLKSLRISKCSEKLDCLDEEDDTKDRMSWKALRLLQELSIEGFENLTTLPKALQQLGKLVTLKIIGCPKMKHLSSTFKHLQSLDNLTLSKCSEELDCLYKETHDEMPWKALRRLETLEIEGFENLTALPKALRNLGRLSNLKINDCKRLEGGMNSLPVRSNLTALTVKSCPLFFRSIEKFKAEHPDVEVSVDE